MRPFCTLLMLLAVAACGGGTSGASAEIGPDGGTVAVTNADSPINGVKVEIPPGALPGPAKVELRLRESANGLPRMQAGFAAFSPVVELATDVPFTREVRVVFPIGGGVLREDQILSAYRAGDASWQLVLPDAVGSGSFSIQTKDAGVFRWGLTLLLEVDPAALRPALQTLYGAGTWAQMEAATQEQVGKLVGEIRDNPWKWSDCDFLGLVADIIKAARAAHERDLAASLAPACGSCDLTGREFIGQLFEYYKLKAGEWVMNELASSGGLPFPLDILAQWAASAYYHHLIKHLSCDYECLVDKSSPAFWGHVAGYAACEVSLAVVALIVADSTCPKMGP